MTTEAEKRAIGLLETLTTEVADQRGENRAHHKAIDKQLDALAQDVDAIRGAQVQQGLRIAALPCDAHNATMSRNARRISEAVKRIANAEHTGRIELTKGESRRDTLRSLGRIALGLFAVLGVLWPILWALTH